MPSLFSLAAISAAACSRSSVQSPCRSTKLARPWPLGCMLRCSPRRRRPAVAIEPLPIILPFGGRCDAIDGGWPGKPRCMFGRQRHQRPLAFPGLLDCREKQAAIGGNTFVGLAEMFARAVLDRALRLDRPLIVDI